MKIENKENKVQNKEYLIISNSDPFRKFNLKRNLIELLDYIMQNGPYRCP